MGFAVDLTAVIVNEAGHSNLQMPCTLHIDVVCAVAVLVINIEISTDVDGPCWRGRAAALTGTEDRRFEGVLVVVAADAEFCLDAIHSVLKHVAVNVCNITM